jgi:hypothetical protein
MKQLLISSWNFLATSLSVDIENWMVKMSVLCYSKLDSSVGYWLLKQTWPDLATKTCTYIKIQILTPAKL